MPERDARVTIRVEQDRKDRWKTAADRDNGEYKDLTHLVVRGVERELADASQTDSPNSPRPTGDLTVDLDGIHNRLDAIHEDIRLVDEKVDDVAVTASKAAAEDEMEMAQYIMGVLPKAPAPKVAQRRSDPTNSDEDEVFRLGVEDEVVVWVHQRTGWAKEAIRDTIDRMVAEMDSVDRVESQRGQTRLYRPE